MATKKTTTSNSKSNVSGGTFQRNLVRVNALSLSVIFILGIALVGAGYVLKSHAYTCTQRVFRQGSRGNCVVYLQIMANNLASNSVMSYDGIFGPKTKTAVIYYQQRYGLADDGVVGPKTWTSMCVEAGRSGGANMGEIAASAGC